MKPIKIGIIGCGQITINAHIPNLNTIPDVKTVALCDQSEEFLNRADKIYIDGITIQFAFINLLSQPRNVRKKIVKQGVAGAVVGHKKPAAAYTGKG